jgi:PKHD-type hydroxylase
MMLHQIKGVLNAEQLVVARDLLAHATFVDGKLSAGELARRVKNNQEADPASLPIDQVNNLVMGALVTHPDYAATTMPRQIAAPYYVRYQPGMGYGAHVDDAVMGPSGQQYRSDISITVFLSPASDYDGGELVIDTAFGQQQVKLPAGDAIVYPSSSLHHVADVTRGERLVAVTWLQSLIRDPAQRQVLYELGVVRDELLASQHNEEQARRLSAVYSNVFRMWADM